MNADGVGVSRDYSNPAVAHRDSAGREGNFARGSDERPLRAAGSAQALLYQKENKCIRGADARSKFALEGNIVALVERRGLDRVFEFTVTTPDNCVRHGDFGDRWHSFLSNEGKRLFEEGILVKERQERGALHGHCAVVIRFSYPKVREFPFDEVRNGCYKHVDHRLAKLWAELRRILPKYGFGRFTLLPIRKCGKSFGRYLAKYFCKGFTADRDRGARRWSTWGGAQRVRCNFAWVRSETRWWVGYMAGILEFRDYGDFSRVLGPRWGKTLLGWTRHGGHFLRPDSVRAVAALLRAQFFDEGHWLASQYMAVPALSLGEVCALKPQLEGLLTW